MPTAYQFLAACLVVVCHKKKYGNYTFSPLLFPLLSYALPPILLLLHLSPLPSFLSPPLHLHHSHSPHPLSWECRGVAPAKIFLFQINTLFRY